MINLKRDFSDFIVLIDLIFILYSYFFVKIQNTNTKFDLV